MASEQIHKNGKIICQSARFHNLYLHVDLYTKSLGGLTHWAEVELNFTVFAEAQVSAWQ